MLLDFLFSAVFVLFWISLAFLCCYILIVFDCLFLGLLCFLGSGGFYFLCAFSSVSAMVSVSNFSKVDLTIANLNKDDANLYNQAFAKPLVVNADFVEKFFSFDVSAYNKEILNRFGLPISLSATKYHSHPASKMIENYMLFVVCSDVLRSRAFSAGFIKDSKLKDLNLFLKPDVSISGVDFVGFHNVKDFVRYRCKDSFDLVACENRFPRRFPVGASLFLHDTLHFFSEVDFDKLVVDYKPDMILATVVLPPEILSGCRKSAFPSLYSFSVDTKGFVKRLGDSLKLSDGSFTFFPDDSSDSSYNQPIHGFWLLECSYFVATDGAIYTFEKLRTIGAHHVLLIKRGKFVLSEPTYCFSESDLLDVSEIEKLNHRYGLDPVRFSMVNKIMPFIKTLKKPDVQSAVAKYRLNRDKEVSMSELMIIEDLVQSLITGVTVGLTELNVFRRFQDNLIEKIPNPFKFIFSGRYSSLVINRALFHLKSCSFVVHRRAFGSKYPFVLHSKVLNAFFSKSEPSSSFERLCPIKCSLFGSGYTFGLMNYRDFYLRDSPSPSCSSVRDFFRRSAFFADRLAGSDLVTVNEKNFEVSIVDPLLMDDSLDCVLFEDCARNCSCMGDGRCFFQSKSFYNFCKDHVTWDGRTIQIDAGFISSVSVFPSVLSFACRVLRCRAGFFFLRNCLGFSIASFSSTSNVVFLFGKSFVSDRLCFHCVHDPPVVDVVLTAVSVGDIPEHVHCGAPSCATSDASLVFGTGSDTHCYVFALSEAFDLNFDEVYNWFTFGVSDDCVTRHSLGLGLTLSEIDDVLKREGLAVRVVGDCEFKFLGSQSSLFASRPLIVSDNHLSCDTHKVLKEVVSKVLDFNAVDLGLTSSSFSVNVSAASALCKCFANGLTGLIAKKLNVSFVEDEVLHDDLTIFTKYGFAGCGKSRSLQNFLKDFEGRFLVISPRKLLAADWIVKTKKKFSVKTFESALSCNLKTFDVIVLDEFFLLPNGYLDLIVCLLGSHANVVKLVLLGDPIQHKYFSEHDEGRLIKDVSFPGDKGSYRSYTFRCGSWISDFLTDVVSFRSSGKDVVDLCSGFERVTEPFGDVVLFPDRDSKLDFLDLMKKTGSNISAYTFGESQGLTFKRGSIVINHASFLCGDNQFLVALTRFEDCPKLLITGLSGYSLEVKIKKFKSLLVSKALVFEKTTIVETFPALKSMCCLSKVVNGKVRCKLSKQEADPGLYALLDDNALDVDDGVSYRKDNEVVVQELSDFDLEDQGKVHLLITSDTVLLAEDEELLGDADFRNTLVLENSRCRTDLKQKISIPTPLVTIVDEFKFAEELKCGLTAVVTDQFTEVNNRAGSSSNVVSCYQALYPNHRHDDFNTFLASLQKRVRKTDHTPEVLKLRAYEVEGSVGDELFDAFLNFIPLRRLRESDYVEASLEFLSNRNKKSAGTLLSHADRSEIDWAMNIVNLFLKNQRCTKDDNRGISAKNGQTIACFSHETLCHFGFFCKAVERMFLDVLPDNILINLGLSPAEMSSWVRDFHPGDGFVCVESDYSAFDQSQDCAILAFERKLLKFVGWPDSLVEDYTLLKLHVGCRFGNLAVMRFTGEFSTFLFNSFANMAFTFRRYSFSDKKVPMMFAGDDMVILSNVPERVDSSSVNFFDRLKLRAKVKRSFCPMFCGWFVTPLGVVKRPRLIHDRLRIAIERDRVSEVIASYFIETMEAYSFGDNLYSLFSEADVLRHQFCVRFFVVNKKLLPTSLHSLVEALAIKFDEEIPNRSFCCVC